ncbi:MAG TPA: FtsX-like permease family protein [Gemmatimonadales bacterium]|nr:FtsX-like permease family protein [Gemmatimonadales bacterium]
MPFELLVALRYLREGRTQTTLILTGIGVGVGVIIFLSALITGLQRSLVARTLGTQAHVVVRPREEMPRVLAPPDPGAARVTQVERPAQRIRSIVQWQRAQAEIARLPGVVATAPTIAGPAIAVRGDGASAVTVRGIDPASYGRIVDLGAFLRAGRLELDGFHAVIGAELARYLGLSVGDRFRLRVSGSAAADTGTGEPAGGDGVYTVSGILDLGNRDLNQRWVFVALRASQSLFGLEGGVSTIEVTVAGIYDAERLAGAITRRTGLVADSWMRTNEQLLTALRSQSASSRTIQTFVGLAVALGIASVLAVSVVQKAREIGILRATGTSRRQVLRIFLLQGAILGLLGSAVGIALGAALGLLFARLARNPDGSATFPVALGAVLYLRSAALAVGVGVAAALLPARRAAGVEPARIIRAG